MNKSLRLLLASLFLASGLHAERILTGSEAASIAREAETIRFKDFSSVPAFIRFYPASRIAYTNWDGWMKEHFFKGSNSTTFKLIRQEEDKLGMLHFRFQQYEQGFPVEYGIWIVHVLQGEVVSMNGELFADMPQFSVGLPAAEALSSALDHVGASMYKWQIPGEEAHLKLEQMDPEATYFPSGELCIINSDPTLQESNQALCWKFNIYAAQPMSRREVFVNAQTGAIHTENDLIHHVDSAGTAVTGYSGIKPMMADFSSGQFRLREVGRGNGIQTFNMNMGISYGASTDFLDSDNYWNNVNAQLDQYATDAHYGAEMTYDYFYQSFSRNSIDGNGFTLNSYVHYDLVEAGYPNLMNAFWDGQRMSYGDGNNSPLTSLDVAGHEITHGLTTFTADLNYSYESGALNESFSDIFGTAVEFFALGASSGDWLIGEDFGAFRSMSNPNQYGDPDTYQGSNWVFGASDNGGVHTNSGVQNRWFHLLSVGGSGTNDNGDAFSVTGIGIADAGAIAFRNLTVYLTPTSQFADARFYALQAAMDLFGPCSQQVTSTGMAWYAVGVGAPYASTVVADFTAPSSVSCQVPFTLTFSNYSSNATAYNWNFGDGSTSTQFQPTHTYTQPGTYNVSLQVSSTCGSDTKVENALVEIGPDVPCEVVLPQSGEAPLQTGCEGVLYDNGGANGDYLAGSTSSVTIAPCGSSSITLTYLAFNVEGGGTNGSCPYDNLKIYDGPGTSGTLLATYCGSNQPPMVDVFNVTDGLTLEFYADQYVEFSGFEIQWSCDQGSGVPEAAFAYSADQSCDGYYEFIDQSTGCPDAWEWDFGDGNTSTLENPTHFYALNGTYTVQLKVSNSMGEDSVVSESIVTVSRDPGPVGSDVDLCPNESATLIVSSTGENRWYDSPFSTTPIHVGDTFVTPILTTSTAYYVDYSVPEIQGNVGPADNTFGGGGTLNFEQYLVFDALQAFTLRSVRIYADGAGDRTIEWRTSDGTVMEQRTVTLDDGEQVVDLDFNITQGDDHQLGVASGSMVSMYRNNSGVSYPYTYPMVASITRSSAGNNALGFYYFFYDWQIEKSCVSERTTVVASMAECLGVEELNLAAATLYPNPNNGSFTLDLGNAVGVTVEVFNARGQLVEMPDMTTNASLMNVQIPGQAGIYFVRLRQGTGSRTLKVVVQ